METATLMNVWKTMPDSEAARIVGRSLSACRGKADLLYCFDSIFRKTVKERYGEYHEIINDSRSRAQVGCANRNRYPKPRDGSGRFIRVGQRDRLAERDDSRTLWQRQRVPDRTDRDHGGARFADCTRRCDSGESSSYSTARLSVRQSSGALSAERVGHAIANASATSDRVLG